jgi:hypothetical protein
MATAPQLPLPAQRWLSRNWLTSVMFVTYLFLTLLVIEQGRTIKNQGDLIHELFSDSQQLSALRGQLLQEHHAARTKK